MRRLIYLIILLLVTIIPIIIIVILPWKIRYRVFNIFYGIICKIINLEVELIGDITSERPRIFVGNHTSYLDILVLGSLLPASFVSKASVANWPLVGQIGKLTGTLFIKRDRKLADSHVKQMHAALQDGCSLTFFPEGTTGDGVKILPFKTSLFKLAERHKIHIQPITIRYSHINGLPIHRNEKTLMSWIGDMTLMPHLKEFLSLGKIRVQVVMHNPIESDENTDRKKLAKKCEELVAGSY